MGEHWINKNKLTKWYMGIAGTLIHVCGKGSTRCVTLRSMEKHDQIIYIQIFKNQPTKVCLNVLVYQYQKKKRYWYIETILFWCIFQIWRSCLTIAKYKDWQELVLKQLIKYHESTLKYFSWYRGIYCWWFFPLTILLFPTSKALVDRWFGLPTKNAISCFFSLKFN